LKLDWTETPASIHGMSDEKELVEIFFEQDDEVEDKSQT